MSSWTNRNRKEKEAKIGGPTLSGHRLSLIPTIKLGLNNIRLWYVFFISIVIDI